MCKTGKISFFLSLFMYCHCEQNQQTQREIIFHIYSEISKHREREPNTKS